MNCAEELFQHLERLTGCSETERIRIGTVPSELPAVYALFFPGFPGPGLLTSLTLGVGLGSHVDELASHVEIVTTLHTEDRAWGLAAAQLAEEAREQAVLAPGSTLSCDDPISEASEMSGFVLTYPHLWPRSATRFRCDDRTVTLLEAHPLYPGELAAIRHCSRDRATAILEGPTYDPCRAELGFGAA